MNIYPDNTLAAYTTQLARRVTLEGDWEVALSEIQYPTLFSNIIGLDVWLNVEYRSGINNKKKFTFPEGIYDKVENVLSILNEEFKNDLKFEYISTLNRIKISFEYMKISAIRSAPKLAVLLGFSLPIEVGRFHYFPIFDESIFRKTYSPELQKQIEKELDSGLDEIHLLTLYPFTVHFDVPVHIYIYTDVIEANFIGDSIAPLLRIVKIEHDSPDNNGQNRSQHLITYLS